VVERRADQSMIASCIDGQSQVTGQLCSHTVPQNSKMCHGMLRGSSSTSHECGTAKVLHGFPGCPCGEASGVRSWKAWEDVPATNAQATPRIETIARSKSYAQMYDSCRWLQSSAGLNPFLESNLEELRYILTYCPPTQTPLICLASLVFSGCQIVI
jgi:hypothetical protein